MKLRVTLEGITYDLDVEFLEDDEGHPAPAPRLSTPPPTGGKSAPTAASASPAKPAPLPEGADNTVTSPISGTVFKLLVKVGDTVEANQDLLILEAMKMETNIVAALAGTIKNVVVAEGDAVSQGQLLIEFE